MPTQPLEHFDFATSFEAKTFTVIVEAQHSSACGEQSYAFLAQGWESLLTEIALVVFSGSVKPGMALTPDTRDELLDQLGNPDQWEWATTSDMNPFRAVWQNSVYKITIIRLFENKLERVLFQHGFPGGRRPGEADDED